VLFAAQCGQRLDFNSLTLRLQPDEGISLRFNGKVPGTSIAVRPVRMQFSYDSEFGSYTPEAYERLLLDAMVGDATLFIRRDEVETAWRFVDAVRAGWAGKPLTNREFYAAGTWGPVAADDLLAQSGHAWHEPMANHDLAQRLNGAPEHEQAISLPPPPPDKRDFSPRAESPSSV
jgi:glucose-6-phosphate 1-dehydrogenase